MEIDINIIKNHIINNFLVPYYKYSSVSMPKIVIMDIKKHSWFECDYDYDTNNLSVNIDNFIINIKFIWGPSSLNNKITVLKNFE